MKVRTINITPKNLEWKLKEVLEAIQRRIKASLPVVRVEIGEIRRRDDQNRHIHALIRDISKQVALTCPETEEDCYFSDKAWKAKLVDEFEKELKGMGRQLAHPSETVISLDLQRLITLRASTTEFLEPEAADFIHFLYAYGSENGVQWSDPALKAYECYPEASAFTREQAI